MTPSLLEGPRLRLLAAALVVFNGFFPALWILLTSLKTETELVSKPITWLPAQATLDNYVRAFTDQPLLAYMANSAIVAFGATALSLVVSSGAAYAIARLNLRHRQLMLTASSPPACSRWSRCWCPSSRPCAPWACSTPTPRSSCPTWCSTCRCARWCW
jgi:ABC-type spermidine/putrescine transport system permease subunit II